ncbi:hypothetical protein EI555_008786 [Monodon monoceros]|uniref:Uncharacterized protein n=1 Tax=Monodon monoceros TaxID=40151 RepID=A0A4U1EVM3_MONMO|nr:hypothetical protein EI555_008786 [Monodon monoceros]
MDHLQNCYAKLKEQLETSREEMIGLQERDTQLQCKNRNLHQLLKNEKDEVQKLQNIITTNKKLKKPELEIQQCKEIIKTRQQLLQQQLATACDDDTTSLLQDCYWLEEKERLKEEWSLFKEQKKNFEKD